MTGVQTCALPIWQASWQSTIWYQNASKTKQAYEQLKKTFPDNAAFLEKLENLKRQKLRLECTIEDEPKRIQQKAKDETELMNAHKLLLGHIKKRRAERTGVIEKWQQGADQTKIKIDLLPFGNLANAESSLRSLLRKTSGEFAADIYMESATGASGLLAELTRENPELGLVKIKERIKSKKGFDKRLTKHIEVLIEGNAEWEAEVELWFPEDRLNLTLLNPSGSRLNVETGSAGQRNAALLTLLLALDDRPIIIDQPEDDLDTKLISSLIVTGIRRIKRKQQIIVVTHNANIPVNGAAEHIVELRYRTGQIWVETQGALQNTEIRSAVCEVLEGGKDALANRYYKIYKALEYNQSQT